MALTVLKDRILAKEYKVEEKTSGGIIIPETVQQGNKYTYVAVKTGSDVTEIDEGQVFVVGDRTASSVDFVVLDKEMYKIFTEGQIVGVLNDN